MNVNLFIISMSIIIGICLGLYLKNMALIFLVFLILMYVICSKYKDLKSIKIFYVKGIFKYRGMLKIGILVCIFVFINTVYSDFKYRNLYEKLDEVNAIGEVVSNVEEKEITNKYIVKIKSVNFNTKYINTKLIVYTPKDKCFKYGDYLQINGEFEYATVARNDKGFDYQRYLRQNKIYGIIKCEEVKVIGHKNSIFEKIFDLRKILEKRLKKMFNENESAFLEGILLGEKKDVSEEISDDFRNSGLAHILAISGMHVVYVVSGIKFVLNIIIKNKRIEKFIIIMFLIFFMIFTGGSPSCVRACLMMILLMLSKVVYRKSDGISSLFISLDILLILNPYNLENIGMWLSVLGTLGLLILPIKFNVFKSLESSLSVNTMIFPIIWMEYNTVSLTFFISNILISFFIGPIIILGYIILILNLDFFLFLKLESFMISIIFYVAKLISSISFSNIVVSSNFGILFIFYYLCIFYFSIEYKLKFNKSISFCNFIILKYKSIKNIILKLSDITKMKILFGLVISIIIFFLFKNFFNIDLKIDFLDVDQGDCCLIITPTGKNILIDGGNNKGYDYGEKVVMPYLLKHGITNIDYMIISHMDSDHCGGLLTILRKIKVEQVIIGIQFEDSDNLQRFQKIVNENKIDVMIVEKGQRINIEKNLYFDILWPYSRQIIQNNLINNNALVCKLVYEDFSMLFTGDIEEETEKILINEYKNSNVLTSTILKVAHHGSNSSSIQKFLELVKPRIALIGVGKNNKFGHPNEEVLERLKKMQCEIYRTDDNGEISIVVNSKCKLKITNKINYR